MAADERLGGRQGAPAVLRTEGLAVGYGAAPLVEGIDLSVTAGQIVTLIGPNGAGKSTLLRTLAGQLAPMGGVAYLSGRRLADLTDRERALELSVLLTERLRTDLMTCEDVVETGRLPHTGRLGILAPEDHDRVRAAMELVQVWDLRTHDFMQLSDGQRQRVLLARAICQEPRTLVLDEPTSYLDIHYQIELLGVLRRLAATREVGILMSLHELPLARRVSDWVVCVKDGRIVAQGTPAQMFVPEVIDDLYDLAPGVYDAATGSIELPDFAREERRHATS